MKTFHVDPRPGPTVIAAQAGKGDEFSLASMIVRAVGAYGLDISAIKPRLLISPPNLKLDHTQTHSFGLPAAFACPGRGVCARSCLALNAHYVSRTVARARISNLMWIAEHGYEKFQKVMRSMIETEGIETFRWHDSGDFFSQEYLDAVIRIMWLLPDVLFYCYTKSLHLNWSGILGLENFNRVQSYGGRHDNFIDRTRPHSVVVDSWEGVEHWMGKGYTYGSISELPAINRERDVVGIVLMDTVRKAQIKKRLEEV